MKPDLNMGLLGFHAVLPLSCLPFNFPLILSVTLLVHPSPSASFFFPLSLVLLAVLSPHQGIGGATVAEQDRTTALDLMLKNTHEDILLSILMSSVSPGMAEKKNVHRVLAFFLIAAEERIKIKVFICDYPSDMQ